MNILARTPRSETMRVFDTLPARIRRAVAFADFPYDPREIAARLERGRRVASVARSLEKRRTIR